MIQSIDYAAMVALLRRAETKVIEKHEWLGQLDAYAGDGDHGTTMKRAMGCIETAIVASAEGDLPALLTDVGWALLGVDGGSTGPLLGTLFNGLAESAAGQTELDTTGFAAAFEAGLAAVQRQTKAQPGDKTMMDALVPAVQALRSAADSGVGVAQALDQAASAAEAGAVATTDMQAKFGRARNLGERSKGSPDAGATSMSLLFRAFAEAAA